RSRRELGRPVPRYRRGISASHALLEGLRLRCQMGTSSAAGAAGVIRELAVRLSMAPPRGTMSRVNLESLVAPAASQGRGRGGSVAGRHAMFALLVLGSLPLVLAGAPRQAAAAAAAAAAPASGPMPAAFQDVAGLTRRALAAALDAVACARTRGVAGRD